MPTDQPSSAPDRLQPHDEASPAAVLSDDTPDVTPGGGGLGGAAAAGRSGSPAGTAPNAPIDVPTPATGDADGTPPTADAEARRQAVGNDPVEPHPSSR